MGGCKNTTSGCRVRAYKHAFHGPNHGVGENAGSEWPGDATRCMKDCNICVHWSGITAYDVKDCPETTVWAGHYRENAYSYPMGSKSGGLPYALAVSGRNQLDSGWNDNLWGFSVHKVRGKNSNELSYDIQTKGIKQGLENEIVLPQRGISADRDDVILGNIKNNSRAAKPCPGGTGQFLQGARKVRCFYGKSNESKLRDLHANRNGITNDPRASMFSKLKEEFCQITENAFKNPGGGNCLEYDEGKRIAKAYCRVGDRIATDANCTKDNLGNHYEELAAEYCKNKGRNNQWCSCYNVSNDVCKTHPTAAGCAKKKQVFDPLVEATPEKFRHVWSGKAKCFGNVCVGNKYVPTNANQGCDAPVQICAQSFDLDNISGSTIEAKCEQTAIQNNSSSQPSTQPSAGDSPSGPTPAPVPTPDQDQGQGAITNSQIPAIDIDLNALTDQQKVTVGIAALCLCLMFFLIIF